MAIDAITAAADRNHELQFPNMTTWAIAEDNLTDTWAHSARSYPTEPSGDAVALSQAAFAKYSALLLTPPPPPLPPPPPSNSTPAGYAPHTGGYWQKGKKHGAGHTIATCAATCTAARAACVAFELSATQACYTFASASGGFIKNPGCRTFTKTQPEAGRSPGEGFAEFCAAFVSGA